MDAVVELLRGIEGCAAAAETAQARKLTGAALLYLLKMEGGLDKLGVECPIAQSQIRAAVDKKRTGSR